MTPKSDEPQFKRVPLRVDDLGTVVTQRLSGTQLRRLELWLKSQAIPTTPGIKECEK